MVPDPVLRQNLLKVWGKKRKIKIFVFFAIFSFRKICKHGSAAWAQPLGYIYIYIYTKTNGVAGTGCSPSKSFEIDTVSSLRICSKHQTTMHLLVLLSFQMCAFEHVLKWTTLLTSGFGYKSTHAICRA